MGDFDVKSLSSYNKIDKPEEAQSNKTLSSEDLKNFRELANLYFATDEDIRNMEQFLKERKKVRNSLTQRIMKFMGDYDIEDLDTNKGRLVYSVSMRKSSLSASALKKLAIKFFGNEQQATAFLKHIDNRDEKEVASLKFIRNKEDESSS